MNDTRDLVEADEQRQVATNARSFERELLIAKLEAERLGPVSHRADDPRDEQMDNAYRRGWNDRAESLIAMLRGGK